MDNNHNKIKLMDVNLPSDKSKGSITIVFDNTKQKISNFNKLWKCQNNINK